VAIPGFDRTKIDPSIYVKRIKEVEGLHRLLLFDKLINDNMEWGSTRHTYVTTLDNCIHGGKTFCSQCHQSLHEELEPVRAIVLDSSKPLSWDKERVVFQDLEYVGTKQ